MILRPRTYGWFSLILAANLVMFVAAPVASVLLAFLVPIALWQAGGVAAVAGGALVTFAVLVILPRLAPRSPLALPAALAQTHLALLWGLWLLRRRHDPVYEPIAEVREVWKDRQEA